MPQLKLINLKVLLPYQVFIEKSEVLEIVAETREGSFGLLPNRLDCVAALVPGILTFTKQNEKETFLAVDEGILVKNGFDVFISVRNAIAGDDLNQLRQTVDREFLTLDEQEKTDSTVMAKMESSFIHQLAELHHD